MARSAQTVVPCVLLALSSLACGSARLVHRNHAGGTIALDGQREEAMKQARQQMLEHCRGPYQIVEEGETVVGEPNTEETHVAADGSEVTKGRGEKRSKTEWRIRYVCGSTRRAPPPPSDQARPDASTPESPARPAPSDPGATEAVGDGDADEKKKEKREKSVKPTRSAPNGSRPKGHSPPKGDDGYEMPDEDEAPYSDDSQSPPGNGAKDR